jgi:hypothetical protein
MEPGSLEQKGGEVVLLKAKILKTEVKKNVHYDPQTGAPDPSYFLEAVVVDLETHTVYHCSFRDAYAEQLRQAYLEKWSEADRDALAKKVETEAKQERENREIMLEVVDIPRDRDVIMLLVKPMEP